MKIVYLLRDEDETGVSGTGVVATGVLWNDGKVTLKWNTQTTSMGVYDNLDDVIDIHGHGGKTRIVVSDFSITKDAQIEITRKGLINDTVIRDA